jgi:valyl-tRNA synthetase
MNDNIKIYPSKFKNTYKYWMENVKDWCISRQLWWGHRIPAFYMPSGEIIVAKDAEEAFNIAKSKNNKLRPEDIKQDEDVLDTWFSSWLWPISVFDGIRYPSNNDIKYYYPTDDLVTAPEILFFWVARMIIAGYEFKGERPFKNVYLTGIVRDKLGRKMSKSLGNSPEPLLLIENFGADGVRVGMLLCSPAGGDLLFDESLVEQGRNFANKIWNAFRLVKTWDSDDSLPQPDASEIAIEWFNSKLNSSIEVLNSQFSQFRISEALMTVYRLFWDDFSSWYLEIIKPEYQKPIDMITLNQTIDIFEKLLKLLHPFMPFITEEIWHLIKERKNNESITISLLPGKGNYNSGINENFEQVKEIITFIRSIRKDNNIPFKDKLILYVKDNKGFSLSNLDCIITKLCNLSDIKDVDLKPENSFSFIIKTSEYFIPYMKHIDYQEEIDKLKKELKYYKEFLDSIENKLINERFIKSAPEKVINLERVKKQDTEIKIKALTEQINNLLTKVTK